MKKILRFIAFAMTFSIIAGTASIYSGTADISADKNINAYTAEEQKLFDCISKLASIKERANQYKHMHNTSENDINSEYTKMKSSVESLRCKLTSMGTKPDTEKLAKLKPKEPMKLNGILNDDFSDFENPSDDVYDLWGIERTVNASYGTYYIYEVIHTGLRRQ